MFWKIFPTVSNFVPLEILNVSDSWAYYNLACKTVTAAKICNSKLYIILSDKPF